MLKLTRRQIHDTFKFTIGFSYCEIEGIEIFFERIAFIGSQYGWAADVRPVTFDRIAIIDGYGPEYDVRGTKEDVEYIKKIISEFRRGMLTINECQGEISGWAKDKYKKFIEECTEESKENARKANDEDHYWKYDSKKWIEYTKRHNR